MAASPLILGICLIVAGVCVVTPAAAAIFFLSNYGFFMAPSDHRFGQLLLCLGPASFVVPGIIFLLAARGESRAWEDLLPILAVTALAPLMCVVGIPLLERKRRERMIEDGIDPDMPGVV
jgi:hypothetical protein